jgi:hypothetical protein
MMAASLHTQLEQAKNYLEDAQIAYSGALVAHAEAKRVLELAEAHKLCGGVEGKNERERSAKLRLELAAEYVALAQAEDALTEARCEFEVAKLEWELARYKLHATDNHIDELAKAA